MERTVVRYFTCLDLRIKNSMQQNLPTLAVTHSDALKGLAFALATNFNVPAQSLINRAIAKMGIARVTYETIIAYQDARHYQPIPKRLLAGWSAY